MPDFSSLEEQLSALAKPQLSATKRHSLDRLIDDLAEESVNTAEAEQSPQPQRRMFWGAAAALIVAALILGALVKSPTELAAPSVSHFDSSQINLVALESSPSVERVREQISEDLILEEDASWPVKSVRYHVVTEHIVQDEASGIILTISEPVEELVMSSQQVF